MNPARPLTDRRLARLSLWLTLTIAWFVARVLAHVAPQAAARMLARYARDARLLIVARAVTRLGFRAPKRGPIPRQTRRLTCRRIAGAAWRRASRQRTLAGRARALCALLAASERWIGAVARRLKRGFTKLRCLPKPRRSWLRALPHARSTLALAADTS